MLRLVVLVLLLANAGYFAWSQGLLASWGYAPTQQSEPQRLEQQIRPQAVRVMKTEESKQLEAGAGSRPTECLQAGPFEEKQSASLKQAMEAWPSGSWLLENAVEPGRWIVYMGKYPAAENVARKKAELRQLGISFEPLSNPSLEPGLSLGGYSSEAEATRHMAVLGEKGVHTAKVVQERPELRGPMLKLPAVDDTLRSRLDDLKPTLAGKTFRACR
jgi:hypothetical protein